MYKQKLVFFTIFFNTLMGILDFSIINLIREMQSLHIHIQTECSWNESRKIASSIKLESREWNENREKRGEGDPVDGVSRVILSRWNGTWSRVVKMKTLSRYQSAGIFQAGEAYIAEEEWAQFGRLTGVAVAVFGKAHRPFSIPFSRHAVTTLPSLFLLPRRSIFSPFVEK